jgi:predicted N-acyltransferase
MSCLRVSNKMMQSFSMSAYVNEEPRAVARVVPRIGDIQACAWDACANPDPATYDPFVSHAFLGALEDSGTVGGRDTGWLPHHITLEDSARQISACMPCYIKLHSTGEYVFDFTWAEAYERAGGRYYPKLQAAVPFTPVPGRRLLVKPGENTKNSEVLLAAAAVELSQRLGASSLHVTFLTKSEWRRLADLSFLRRTDQQFHWYNEQYATFDDFLAQLSSRKRKTIRKERAEALSDGLSIEKISGTNITEAHWDAFHKFYMNTSSRKWGRPYLNRHFFSLLGEAMGERCLLILAKRSGRYVAGALNFLGGDCLYGRYWGAIEHHPCLHFEICYYQAIDYAIEAGLPRVEAGAQGEHKLTRGYRPVTTYSAHWIQDANLRRAIASYLDDERREVAETSAFLAACGPYRKDGSENRR